MSTPRPTDDLARACLLADLDEDTPVFTVRIDGGDIFVHLGDAGREPAR